MSERIPGTIVPVGWLDEQHAAATRLIEPSKPQAAHDRASATPRLIAATLVGCIITGFAMAAGKVVGAW